MNILYKVPVQVINKLLVVHQPTLYVLWIRLADPESLPTDEHVWTGVITCGGVRRGTGLGGWWGGGGGGVDMALHRLPIWGHVLKVGGWGGRRGSGLRFQGGGSNTALGLRKRILFIKKEGGSRWDGDLELKAGPGGDSPGFQQLTSSSHPCSGMVPGTQMERLALMMSNASLMNPFGKGVKITSSSRLP